MSAEIERLARRVDDLVRLTAQDQIWGKALWREFKGHCVDDDRRHQENLSRMQSGEDAIRALAAALDKNAEAIKSAMDAQLAAHRELNEDFRSMLPMLRRLRSRYVFRRIMVRRVSKMRALFIGAGVLVAAAITWVNEYLPKLGAIFRKLGGGG